jgi:hypothetical protein
MIKAICIKCGAKKQGPFTQCKSCGYKPGKDPNEMAKCVYLSNKYYNEAQKRSHSDSDLMGYGDKIRQGNEEFYGEYELKKLVKEHAVISRLRPIDSLKFASIGILFLLLPAIAVILFFIKSC